jgi:fluoroacetyl-CoA thioesterase
MKDTLQPGLAHVATHLITEDMGTSHAGPPILSTPSMILMMESSCHQTIQDHLDPEETTVGVHVCVSHVAGSVAGEEVAVSCRLAEITKRTLTFEVAARVGDRLLGEGTHKRAVIGPRKPS